MAKAAASGASAKAGIRDVAARAGVALSSVSRVLNNHPDVSPEMRRRVLSAVAELGYQPDLLASGLRRGVTATVGFLVSNLSNPLFADITTGAERALREAGYSLLLATSEGDALRDEQGVRLLSQRRVDGLILTVADETSQGIARVLRELSVPVVLLDRELGAVPSAAAVLVDHASGIRSAVDHLLDGGHRRTALLVGPHTTHPNRERLRGFKEGFRRRRVPLPRDLVETGPALSADFGEQAADRLLALPPERRPSALVAGGNLVLTGVLRACRRHGVRPGEDVAIVSCDDVPLAELSEPPITVVARDTVEMGRQAAELLLRGLAGEDVGGCTVELPTTLVVRGSSGRPSGR